MCISMLSHDASRFLVFRIIPLSENSKRGAGWANAIEFVQNPAVEGTQLARNGETIR
jgi:hypothetical protein